MNFEKRNIFTNVCEHVDQSKKFSEITLFPSQTGGV